MYAGWLFFVLHFSRKAFLEKFYSFIVAFSLLCLTTQAWAVPVAPVISDETDGLHLTEPWTDVHDVSGCIFYSAPYPYTGPELIFYLLNSREVGL